MVLGHAGAEERWQRRRVVYLVVAVLVVVVTVAWTQSTDHPSDPAEADGDPDLGALGLLFSLVSSCLVLALYASLVCITELVIRKGIARRRSTDKPGHHH